MALPRGDGWVDWTEGYRYEPIDAKESRCSACRSRRALAWGAVLCVVGFWGAAKSFLPGAGLESGIGPVVLLEKGTEHDRGASLETDSTPSAQVRVSNGYHETTDLRMYPWEHIAEPYKETSLEVASWPGQGERHIEYRWEIEGDYLGTGAVINTDVFRFPGTHECSVTGFYPEEESSQLRGNPADDRTEELLPPVSSNFTYAFNVTVKYVRREIRTLTDRDRETFFNAVSVMQRVPSAVGREVYGQGYFSRDYFNRMHLYYGGEKDCDHWHAGAGFVTSHIGVSLMYEQSLQAINPSIALPYWDFTIEGTFFDWRDFRTSSVFSDDWFGNAAPRNSMRTPDAGRFAYIPTMVNATQYSNVHNAYGLLRAPWNTDPNPFMTRHDHLFGFANHRKPSGCRKYRDAIRAPTWMRLTVEFNAGAHGDIHELLGGTWSDEAVKYANMTSPIVQPFVHDGVPLLKEVWRAGFMACPDKCTFDMPWDDCHCTCPEGLFEDLRPAQVLEQSGVLAGGKFYDKDFVLIDRLDDENGHAYEALPGYTKEETNDIYATMLRTLCIPMRFGSHYEGTSTNDPTFWVLHPTFDRLWHLSRLENATSFNDTWVSDSPCYGHNADDVQPLHNLFTSDRKFPGDASKLAWNTIEPPKAYYTNMELYWGLRPGEDDLSYLYDNFEWRHCEIQGIYIHGYN